MDRLLDIGAPVRDAILWVASLLRDQRTPGLVSLLLLVALLVVIGLYWRGGRSRTAALTWLREAIEGTGDQADFNTKISDLDVQIESEGKSKLRERLAFAWSEYRETLVPHEEGGEVVLRNSARPNLFFNVEDLGFGQSGWRIAPGLFVTVGLALTFLGLISALGEMESQDINADTMKVFLAIASAKFIMSLTGLVCSIIFTIVYRGRQHRLDDAVHRLVSAIEGRLTFISLEALATEQLAATREQREHFRKIGMELVAELGRPLREEVPAAISNSISTAMSPLFDQVRRLGAEGMGNMVESLSSRFSDDVGKALSDASRRLSEAGDRIGALSERMDQSSGRIGSEMEAVVGRVAQAVDDLRATMTSSTESARGLLDQGTQRLLEVMNETLVGIRDNTAEGAKAISDAAKEMTAAAGAFRTEVEEASRTGATIAQDRIQRAGDEIARATGEVSAKAGKELLEPMEQMSARLSEFASAIEDGSKAMQRLGDGVRAGSEASLEAASIFRGSSEDMVKAATPLQSIAERIEEAVRRTAASTENVAAVVSRSAETTARSAAAAIESARQILGQEVKAIDAALEGVSGMLERLRGQGDRLDDMDEKLGRAFEQYTEEVAKAVQGMFGHVQTLQSELNPALDTLRQVVEQAEQFFPDSRRP